MRTPEPESRPVPLPEADSHLTQPGHRSGEGLASILPYLVRSLRGKPRVPLPAQAEEKGTSRR